MGCFGPHLHWPEGPWGLRSALFRRLGHDLELMYRGRFLPVARAKTIRASVPAVDDDHALSRSENFNRGIDRISEATLILLRQEFHCQMNSLEFASRDFQIAGTLCASGEHDRVEFAAQIFDRNVLAYLSVG